MDDFIPDPRSEARRRFLKCSGVVGAATGIPAIAAEAPRTAAPGTMQVRFTLNGEPRTLDIDPRTTLLDALRERLHLTGTKKGCDRGQCGACTVLVDDRRVNSCLTLAATLEGAKVTTIEGLSKNGAHPVQAAFLERDAFQCGYCTPGQVMSAVALLKEARGANLSDNEIRERMSGNICRCGAYVNIVAAVKDASRHA